MLPAGQGAPVRAGFQLSSLPTLSRAPLCREHLSGSHLGPSPLTLPEGPVSHCSPPGLAERLPGLERGGRSGGGDHSEPE